MTYGYFNEFITKIGEDVPSKVDELKQHAEMVMTESLSSRIFLFEILDKLQPGDILYVYSFSRFCSGLSDLCELLDTIIDEKGACVISLHDDFDSRTEAGAVAKQAYHTALSLSNGDPTYGAYR